MMQPIPGAATFAIAAQLTDGLSWPSLSFAILVTALLLSGAILLRRYRSRQRLMRRVAELEALSAAGRAIVAAQLDVNALCELIAREAGKVIDNRTFQVGLFDAYTYHILYWTINGRRQETPRSFDLRDEGGIISWVRQTKQPLLVRDFEREMDTLPAKPRYISQAPPRSAIFIPLVSGEETIGTLAAQSHQPARFDEEDTRRLTILANQAAAAIAHAQLFAQERKRAAQLELVGQIGRQINSIQSQEAIFDQVVNLTKETFGFHLVNIFGMNAQTGTAELEASSAPHLLESPWRVRPGQGLIGTAVSQKQTVISNNTIEDERVFIQKSEVEHSTRSEMALPLLMDGELLGVLDVQSPEAEIFTATEKTTLEALAAEIAMAISKVRQLAQQRQQAWMSRAQLQIAEAIGRSSDVDEMVTTVTTLTPSLAGTPFCAIFLWDEEMSEYRGTAVAGIPSDQEDALRQTRLAVGDWGALDAVHVGQQTLTTEHIPDWLQQATHTIEPSLTKVTILPLSTVTQVLGVMLVSDVESNGAGQTHLTTAAQEELLYNISQQTARALENFYLRKAQQEEAWVNTALFQVAATVNNLINLNEILATITRLTPMLVGVDSCIILIWDAEQQLFTAGPSHGISPMGRGLLETLAIDQEEFQDIVPKVVDSLSPTGTYFLVKLPPWLEKVMGAPLVYAFPLNARGQLVGAMVVGMGADNGRSLSARRFNILTGIAQQAATAVVNHQLYQEAAERDRLEQEISVAREIQASLIPAGNPHIPGCTVASSWQAARQVSGDFYDFMELADGHWGIVVADVADKGIPAALFMALCRTILRAVSFSRTDPAQTLMRANEIINQDTQSDHFVTVFYAVWHPQKETITYANGGHNPPLLLRHNGEGQLLTGNGVALGVLPQIDLKSHTIPFKPGDTLLLYTDGVTEAINEDLDEFGLKRLRLAAQSAAHQDAHAVKTAVTEAVHLHAGETPQFDDITLVVIKRNKG